MNNIFIKTNMCYLEKKLTFKLFTLIYQEISYQHFKIPNINLITHIFNK